MMSELERLDEALAAVPELPIKYQYSEHDRFDLTGDQFRSILDAARAYRDLLANGPDYEAALVEFKKFWDRPFASPEADRETCRAMVDAAIGDRLLVPSTEEEK